MTKLHKTIFRVNAISVKIPMMFYTELEQILKFLWKYKKAQTVKANLRKHMATADASLQLDLELKVHCKDKQR